jgi:uncharacterized membrane protein
MPPLRIVLFALLAILLAAIVQVGALEIAFDKPGLEPEAVVWLLLVTLVGSMVNVPLFIHKADVSTPQKIVRRLPEYLPRSFFPRLPGRTVVAVNIGGCVVSVAFSICLS